MRDENETSQSIPEVPPEMLSKDEGKDKQKKTIDELIEEFNRSNPAKNQKRIYRDIF